MKTFYVVLTVFVLLLGIIFANALYIDRTTDALQQQLCLVLSKADAGAAAAAAQEFWEQRRSIVMLSKPMECVWDLDQRLIEVKNATETPQAEDTLTSAIRSAQIAVERIRHLEGLRAAP